MTTRDFSRNWPRNAELLRYSVEHTDNCVVLVLDGELDISNAPALGTTLAEMVSTHPHVIVDLAAVSFLDSSGIRCLVGASKRADAAGSTLVVQRPTASVLRVFQMCGVEDALLIRSNGDAMGGQ